VRQFFAPELIHELKPREARLQKNIFWEHNIGSASERAFSGFLAIFLLLNSLKKEMFQKTRIHSHLVNWCRLSIKSRAAESGKKIVGLQVGWAQVITHICWWLVNSVTRRKMTLLEAPTGTLLLNYKDIKHYCFLQIASLWSLSIWVRIHLEYQ